MRNLADANPDAPALADATTQLTRRDLLAHILDIARLLIDAQLTTGRRVAILLPRTVSQPASLVACAWTGAVAVQLDASAPDAHNQSIIEQAGVDAVYLPFHKANEFIGTSQLPTFICNDVIKNPQVEQYIVNYIAHLEKVFGPA